jgi:hypothetical protein
VKLTGALPLPFALLENLAERPIRKVANLKPAALANAPPPRRRLLKKKTPPPKSNEAFSEPIIGPKPIIGIAKG